MLFFLRIFILRNQRNTWWRGRS